MKSGLKLGPTDHKAPECHRDSVSLLVTDKYLVHMVLHDQIQKASKKEAKKRHFLSSPESQEDK